MKIKFIALVLTALTLSLSAGAQYYHPGEVLEYTVFYRAKLIPKTEVGKATVTTTRSTYRGHNVYRVKGIGRTNPSFKWFFELEDQYNIWVDTSSFKTLRATSDIREGNYTFSSSMNYDWDKNKVYTLWRKKTNPTKGKVMNITAESADAVSLFFRMRAVPTTNFKSGYRGQLDLVLEDTLRHLTFRYVGRQTRDMPGLGRFNAVVFACQIGTSEGFTFTDGTEFMLWLTDDDNKIPLAVESPVRVGMVFAVLTRYKGLKYPLKSLVPQKNRKSGAQ